MQYLIELAGNYKIELAAIILPLILSFIKYASSPKSRVIYSKSHGFCYNVKDNEGGMLIYTETYFLQNIGRKSPTTIEITLNYEPQNFAIWPARDYSSRKNPEGNMIISLPGLNPGEYFTLNMLQAHNQLPRVKNVRTNEGITKEVPMAPMRVWPKSFLLSILALMLIGAMSALYAALLLVDLIFS